MKILFIPNWNVKRLAEMISKDKGELMYMGLIAERVRNDLSERVMGERIYRFVSKIMNED